ncbi:hypothetical protein INR49_014116 [Caranx melampygus]|nr:hypothetical protein INR49_014116 [Caranx melampygus]
MTPGLFQLTEREAITTTLKSLQVFQCHALLSYKACQHVGRRMLHCEMSRAVLTRCEGVLEGMVAGELRRSWTLGLRCQFSLKVSEVTWREAVEDRGAAQRTDQCMRSVTLLQTATA